MSRLSTLLLGSHDFAYFLPPLALVPQQLIYIAANQVYNQIIGKQA
jgi:hypothetical protein